MPTLKTRNRVVVFRLTQEEYEALKNSCNESGGRSLSEFTRSELLAPRDRSSLDQQLETRFLKIERLLSDLQVSISRLVDGITEKRAAVYPIFPKG